MRTTILLALACAAIAVPAQAQDAQVLSNCIDDFSGHACLLAPPGRIMTDADYGAVYIQITPPRSITEQTVKAARKNWKSWLKRFFLPETKSGALVAEIYQGSNKIAVIPVSMFSIDEKKGLSVETGNIFSAMQQATPYFALDPVSNPIRVVLSFQSSKTQSSNILGTFTAATSAASSLGASGYLFTSTNPVATALQPIETAITNNFNAKIDSKLELRFNFENNGGADFSFGFDPSGQDRSGRITFQLVRRGSVFGNFPVANLRPVFPFRDRVDAGAANEVLLRQPGGKPLRSQLQAVTAGQFDKLQQADIKPAEFDAACGVVEPVVLGLGTNAHDVVATMWASMIGAGGIRRADLRKTSCLTRWMSTFAIYGLKLPDPDADTVSGDGRARAGAQAGTAPIADLGESGLRTFMASLFQVMAQADSSETRIRAYQSMLTEFPDPAIDLDAGWGFAGLDDTANSRFVAEKMATLSFRSGCFVRLADKTVSYLARPLPSQSSAGEPLWLMNLRLESERQPATANSTRISSWAIRDAKPADLPIFAAAFPDRPGCSDFSTAPS